MNWIPIDELAIVLLELVTDPGQPLNHVNSINDHVSEAGANVFNVLNPRPTSWQKPLPAIVASLSSLTQERGKPSVQKVPFMEWTKLIRSNFETQSKTVGKTEADLETILEANPAVKLPGFYEEAYKQQHRTWDIRKAREVSVKLSSIGEIEEDCMKKWITSWLT